MRLEGIHGADEVSVRCRFRDFRVINGFFRLNGKRIFLRSTHTLNHCPIGVRVPPPQVRDILRLDLLDMKASGFNMMRLAVGIAYPFQLDLCDEIG
jgi:beta-galactosidase/beta-glucuronidase